MSINKNAGPGPKRTKRPLAARPDRPPAPARESPPGRQQIPRPGKKGINNKKNLQKTIISYMILS
jgi:hypothetical protein